ncbi:MAG: lectin-like protein, partial [Nonlabens sp.]
MRNFLTVVFLCFAISNLYAQSDTCAAATVLTACTVQSGSNVGSTVNTATDDSFAPSDICATSVENTVWYSFTPTASGSHDITSVIGSCTPFNNGLQAGVLSGNCGGPYTSLGCGFLAANSTSTFNTNLTAGQQVFLVLDGDGGDECASIDVSICPVTSCNDPDIPNVSFAPGTICDGNSALLSWSGSLNDATIWRVYSGSCSGTLVGSTSGSSTVVSPVAPGTTYYVRGEGGCVTPGSCGSVTVPVTPREDASFTYASANYATADPDPTPTVTGVNGGTFTSLPAGLSINASTGEIDLSATTAGNYTVTYTTPGLCSGSETFQLTITNSVLSLTTSSTDSSCNGNGTATATATGGTAPYTYTWNTGFTETTSGSSTLNNLALGSYTVTVTDAANNSVDELVIVDTGNSPQVFQNNTIDESCAGQNDGTVTVGTHGGVAPYTYSWNITVPGIVTVPTSTNYTVTNLPPNTYIVTSTDASGCVSTVTFTIDPGPADPDLMAVAPLRGCENIILPAITGSATSGSQAYYTQTGGNGTSYAPGDQINFADFPSYPVDLFVYDSNTGISRGSQDTDNTYFDGRSSGLFFDIDVFSSTRYTIESFDLWLAAGSSSSYRIYSKSGSYVGSETNPSAWTLLTTTGNIAPVSGTSPVPLNLNLGLPQIPLSTMAFYIYEVDQTSAIIHGQNLSAGSNLNIASGAANDSEFGTVTNGSTGFPGSVIFGFENTCVVEENVQLTIAQSPSINSIADVNECDSYVLPTIMGSNLSGSQSYYDAPNGGGMVYAQGRTLTAADFMSYPVTLYAYDEALQSNAVATNLNDLQGSNDGIFFDINTTSDIRLQSFDLNLRANETSTFKIYTKPGSFVGSETNAGAWTLLTTSTSITGTGNTTTEPLNLNLNLDLTAGSTTGFYIYAVAGNRPMNYTCVSTNQDTVAGNTIVTVSSGTGSNDEFSNLIGAARGFSGRITYDSSTTGCTDQGSFLLTLVDTPSINPVNNLNGSGSVMLATITGTGLSGNQSYWSMPGGMGTEFQQGDTINYDAGATYPITLYAYDENATDNTCNDEVSFQVTISPPISVTCPADITETCLNNPISFTVAATGGRIFTIPPGGDIAGFTRIGERNNKTYFISNTTLTASNAFTNAIAQGGFVATVDDSGTNTFLRTAVDNIAGAGERVYIGFTDELVENSFGWHSSSTTTYTNWTSGQPDNFGVGEDFVTLDGNGEWNDVPGTTLRRYILELNGTFQQTAGLPAGSVFPVGTTTNTFLVTDLQGNTDTCSFDVDISGIASDALVDQNHAGNYTLPSITGSNLSGSESYFTGPGGTGTAYAANTVINFTDFPSWPQTFYIYDSAGTGCRDEESFTLTLVETVAITEFINNVQAIDPGDEWVELYNYGTSIVDLQNWRIQDEEADDDLITATSYNLGVNDYVILASDKPGFEAQW